MKKDFDKWLTTMKENLSDWSYYTNFDKIYKNIEKIKIELNILNSLIGSKTIKKDFINILKNYPKVLNVIPILIAKRTSEIDIYENKNIKYNFNNKTQTFYEYADFMEKIGLFNLIQNHIVNNLVDYVLGIEVGLDTNSRKNRTGKIMEDIVEKYLKKAGLILNNTYFKQMNIKKIEDNFKIKLNNINSEKVFDFVINYNNTIYAIECNFFNSSGSKLNETARSYKELAKETSSVSGFKFIWITDGIGWKNAKNNLKDTSLVLNELFNLNDLENNVLLDLLNDNR